jgi:hypothetical protein
MPFNNSLIDVFPFIVSSLCKYLIVTRYHFLDILCVISLYFSGSVRGICKGIVPVRVVFFLLKLFLGSASFSIFFGSLGRTLVVTPMGNILLSFLLLSLFLMRFRNSMVADLGSSILVTAAVTSLLGSNPISS